MKDILELLKKHGGKVHGPHVETVSIPLDNFAELIRNAVEEFIKEFSFEDAINAYRCQYFMDGEDGAHLPLDDLFCAAGMPNGNAQTELEVLADHIGGEMLDAIRSRSTKEK